MGDDECRSKTARWREVTRRRRDGRLKGIEKADGEAERAGELGGGGEGGRETAAKTLGCAGSTRVTGDAQRLMVTSCERAYEGEGEKERCREMSADHEAGGAGRGVQRNSSLCIDPRLTLLLQPRERGEGLRMISRTT